MRTVCSLPLLLILAMPGGAVAAEQLSSDAGAEPPVIAPESPIAPSNDKFLPPKAGSHIAEDENLCIQCHGEPDLWDETTKRLYVARDQLADDVHWKKGVNCTDCHGGNAQSTEVNEAHAKESGFRGGGEPARKMCAYCHQDQALDLVKSVHARAGPKNEQGSGTLLRCGECHTGAPHHILPAADSRSPVFLDHQVKTCGRCHEQEEATYGHTVHGHGLYQAGLLVTASCSSCHGAHGVYRAADRRSTLFAGNVSDTCGKCHRFIAERLKDSVHGHGNGPGETADRLAPGGKSRQRPSCTSCHQGHEISVAASSQFRQHLPNLCGNCHADLSSRYAMSIHGELTGLGYQPAANCYDCHGSHTILPVSNPASPVSAENRLATCQKCHPYATANFASFDPHVDYHDRKDSPVVYWVYRVLLTLLLTTFGVFGLHAVLWFVRGTADVLQEGRPKGLVPGTTAYVRFVPMHRQAHAILLVSFLGLALTGLPLKYSEYDWARSLARYLGGFESTSFWHRVFALTTFACFLIYMGRMLKQFRLGHREGKPWRKVVFGPESPVPNWRDVKDFFKMIRWFFWLGPKPGFERWAYWEKFDFWGACADIVIIGFTGLVLWFPNFFCSFLPGVTLNVAKVIHSTQALLATGFIFAIHFFTIHLRAEKFPADMSLLIGLVSEDEMRAERPDYLERLRREGRLSGLEATVPSKWRIRTVKVAGFLALGVGLALLVGIVFASLGG